MRLQPRREFRCEIARGPCTLQPPPFARWRHPVTWHAVSGKRRRRQRRRLSPFRCRVSSHCRSCLLCENECASLLRMSWNLERPLPTPWSLPFPRCLLADRLDPVAQITASSALSRSVCAGVDAFSEQRHAGHSGAVMWALDRNDLALTLNVPYPTRYGTYLSLSVCMSLWDLEPVTWINH